MTRPQWAFSPPHTPKLGMVGTHPFTTTAHCHSTFIPWGESSRSLQYLLPPICYSHYHHYIVTSLHHYNVTTLHCYIIHCYIITSLHCYIITSLQRYIVTSLHHYLPFCVCSLSKITWIVPWTLCMYSVLAIMLAFMCITIQCLASNSVWQC